jgi:hypothetical protein
MGEDRNFGSWKDPQRVRREIQGDSGEIVSDEKLREKLITYFLLYLFYNEN